MRQAWRIMGGDAMSEKGQIFPLMVKVMADVVAIGKDSRNQQQGFNYRSIDAVYNALNPLLAKHGIFMAPEVLDKTREERTNKNGTVLAFTCLRMRYTFYAPDGSSVSCVVEGEGMDSGDKSSNKAMAVAHKYALLQTFCIPTEEQKEADAEVHEVAPANDWISIIADATTLEELREIKTQIGLANIGGAARSSIVAAWNTRKTEIAP